jgi:hypothetical protein
VPTSSADLGAVQQIAFADDADEIAVRDDHWCAADAALGKQVRERLDRHLWTNRYYIGCHYVHRTHLIHLLILSESLMVE